MRAEAKQFAGDLGETFDKTTPGGTCCRTRLREPARDDPRNRDRRSALKQELRRDGQIRGQGREGQRKEGGSKAKDKWDCKRAGSVAVAPGPAPETPEADVALVKSAIAALRSSNASKATEIQANISDPTARKLVEWLILRNDHNGVQSKRYF